MNTDPYRRLARMYDRLFESMNRGLRVLGMHLFRPEAGAAVLDVGCGTGTHLEMYRELGCRLYGIDTSPSMLDRARTRLGESADLRLADATRMPFDDGQFDLVVCMLALHEMDPDVRDAVLGEMARVAGPHGRVLVIDFHAGPPRPIKGWTTKLVILMSEIVAGRRHFRNYRRFMRAGGLPPLIEKGHFSIEKQMTVGGNTLVLVLLRADR